MSEIVGRKIVKIRFRLFYVEKKRKKFLPLPLIHTSNLYKFDNINNKLEGNIKSRNLYSSRVHCHNTNTIGITLKLRTIFKDLEFRSVSVILASTEMMGM